MGQACALTVPVPVRVAVGVCYICACAKEKGFQDYLDYGRVPCNYKKDYGADCVNVVYG